MKLSPAYQLLVLVAVTLGVYYPTLFAPLNSLDDQTLVNLLLNQSGFSLSRHFAPGDTYYYFRPLITLSFEIDKHVGGLQEPFMHLFNILVHAANVVLVWLLARRLRPFVGIASETPAFVAALLFALHPVNTESVNWIMARTDLLAGLFVFAALIALLRHLESRGPDWAIASAACLLLGALCKETALFLLPAAVWFVWCQKSLPWRWRFVLPAAYGLAVAGYFLLRAGAYRVDRGLTHTGMLVAQAVGRGVAPGSEGVGPEVFPWFDALRVVFKASGYYAVKLFQPLPLNFAIHRIPEWYVVPGVVLAVVLIVLFLRRKPLGWLFLLSASLAVSALCVIFTQVAWTPIAERYLYIPSAPFVIGVANAGQLWLGGVIGRRLMTVFVGLLLTVAFAATFSRNLVWQDKLSLYQDTVSKSPDFPGARNHLAAALREKGRFAEALSVQENAHFKGEFGLLTMASAQWNNADYQSARASLEKLLEKPGDYEYQALDQLISMTAVHARAIEDENLRTQLYRDTLGWLERIRNRWPSGFVYYRLGRVHLILNDRAAARLAFAEAARLLPEDSPYREPAAKLARTLEQ